MAVQEGKERMRAGRFFRREEMEPHLRLNMEERWGPDLCNVPRQRWQTPTSQDPTLTGVWGGQRSGSGSGVKISAVLGCLLRPW